MILNYKYNSNEQKKITHFIDVNRLASSNRMNGKSVAHENVKIKCFESIGTIICLNFITIKLPAMSIISNLASTACAISTVHFSDLFVSVLLYYACCFVVDTLRGILIEFI